jgi:hypothetical protein
MIHPLTLAFRNQILFRKEKKPYDDTTPKDYNNPDYGKERPRNVFFIRENRPEGLSGF